MDAVPPKYPDIDRQVVEHVQKAYPLTGNVDSAQVQYWADINDTNALVNTAKNLGVRAASAMTKTQLQLLLVNYAQTK